LATACQTFDISAKGHPLNPDVWQDAMTGEREALKYILEHNREDVVSLEELYDRVIDYTQLRKTSL
jgi:uncharacterized protein YprB with RNaseH-like and TPR domain